ncbi:MAG: hypothetical protein F4017_04275 [Acidimicrobiaceae bacterium]|nr:hypothetical protein [Acidimicrobiaceae bacterium]MYE75222.1 hypothetical protein [Acidimicrobiaceae bacterium]MYH44017.1 hypothetical protein [Acidimicrobiaceae bacterium]MYJ41997.1 hypothetical protein [Acidimicrobiaceae bacterium]MYJ81967.1 hypothetical protein [Acidimicrobiaceae bacterium]
MARTGDLVPLKTRIAVFIDGCGWHGNPDHLARESCGVGPRKSPPP